MRQWRSKALMRASKLEGIEKFLGWIVGMQPYSKPKNPTTQYQSGFSAGVIAGRQALAKDVLESKYDEK